MLLLLLLLFLLFLFSSSSSSSSSSSFTSFSASYNYVSVKALTRVMDSFAELNPSFPFDNAIPES